jgi:hypothetical protein
MKKIQTIGWKDELKIVFSRNRSMHLEGVNTSFPLGKAVPVPLHAPVVLLLLKLDE